MTTRKVYLAELEELTEKVSLMGQKLEAMIDSVKKALTEMDGELANAIIAQDDDIDELERVVEHGCIRIVSKQQPVATDLRRVTSIMRLIGDIERIADHCGDISEYIIALTGESIIPMPENILEMFDAMKKMVGMTIESFITENVQETEEVVKMDDIVDDYFEKIKDELCIAMKHNPEHIRAYADYLLIAKYVERMADHSTNIAEWTAFIVTGDLEQYMNI